MTRKSKKEQFAEDWRKAQAEKYQALAATFEFKLEQENARLTDPSFYDNGKKATCYFNYRMIDEGDKDGVLDRATRLDWFMKKLAHLLASTEHHGNGVGFEMPSFISSTQMLYYKDEPTMLKMLKKQAESTRLNWTLSVPFPEGMIKEDASAEAREINQVVPAWKVLALDYDLNITARVQGIKRASLEQPQGVSIALTFLIDDEDEDDNVLPLEKRIEFFIKKVVAPDMRELMDGEVLKVAQSWRAPSLQKVEKQEVEQILIRCALLTVANRAIQNTFKRSVLMNLYEAD